MKLKIPLLLMLFFFLQAFPGKAQEKNVSHLELASSIFQKIRLSDTEKTDRLVKATVSYLDILEILLDERAHSLAEIDQSHKNSSSDKDSLIVRAYEIAKMKYVPAKKAYLRILDDELQYYQVDRVKDALTKDAFPRFNSMYLEMVPDLKPVEKAHILALLVEGRENAMLAISDKNQKQWWDKYRGIINNYISSQGYDFGKLSKKWGAENSEKEWAH